MWIWLQIWLMTVLYALMNKTPRISDGLGRHAPTAAEAIFGVMGRIAIDGRDRGRAL